MNLIESIRIALGGLRANKLRGGLTMLGIIIGTGAVIALLAVGQGAQAEITEQIQSIGSNLIFVFPGQMQQSGTRTLLRSFRMLTRQDAEAIADPARNPHVAAVAPEVDRTVTLSSLGETVSVNAVGTWPEYEVVRNVHPQYGEFFTAGDESAAARVAVLGGSTATDLFGDPQAALEQTVRINRVPFKVIGVLEEKGGQGMMGGSRDDVVIVPLSTAQKKLFGGRTGSDAGQPVDYINVSAMDEASIEVAIEEVTWTMRDRHDIEFEEDDFSVTSQQDILSVVGQITSILTIVLGAIAGISLLVGGIGIMNIMLVSVTERTREIGIRKAVGARRSDILWQFLVESIVLSVVGGAVGIAFGWAVAFGVEKLADLTTLVTIQAVALAVGFSLAVGLFFGIYPASRASNLHPIDALRYE